jgi:hypothetical protein
MQALLADLLPWVIAFTLADGLVLVRRGHLLMCGAAGLRPLRAGLAWIGLSPLAEAIAVQDLPFLAGGAVYLFDPRRRTDPPWVEAADLTALPAAALAGVERSGKTLSTGGRPLLVAPTAEEARVLQAALAALARGEPPAAPSEDLEAARALRRRQQPWRWALQAAALALALELLGFGGLAAWSPWAERFPAERVVLAVGALLVLSAVGGAAFLRASGEGWRRSVGGGASLLLPWAALHPLAHVARPVFRRFDALTAAAALLPAPAFHTLAARELVRARLSRAATPAALAPVWDARTARLRRLLAATGSSEEEALRPPARTAGAAGWCPLCRGQFREGFARCADCGAEVVGFDA